MSPQPVIGVDAGGTKLLAGVIDEDLTVGQRVRRLWSGGDRAEVLDTMVEAVRDAGADGARAVGFGIPSLLDFATGTSISSVHLPLDGVPFRDLMTERLGMPVFVDNDANLAALAEQRVGAARGASSVVMLTLGTGIGSGVVLDGRVMRGATGAASEIGHMTIDLHGPPCQGTCPGRGCLEVMASGTAIGREGTDAGRREPSSALGRAVAQRGVVTGEEVTALAVEGDPVAGLVMAAIGRNLGAGLASVVNIFQPELIVVGGGAAAAGDLLLDPAREMVAQRALRPGRDTVRIVPAALGEEAGMIGAAVFALAGGEV
ncbi:MAG: glucokinase [Thermoleophilaceae bacterium]|jgi:glucokinase|nr:glucokinase [Thermoleophilaceae bacterium]